MRLVLGTQGHTQHSQDTPVKHTEYCTQDNIASVMFAGLNTTDLELFIFGTCRQLYDSIPMIPAQSNPPLPLHHTLSTRPNPTQLTPANRIHTTPHHTTIRLTSPHHTSHTRAHTHTQTHTHTPAPATAPFPFPRLQGFGSPPIHAPTRSTSTTFPQVTRSASQPNVSRDCSWFRVSGAQISNLRQHGGKAHFTIPHHTIPRCTIPHHTTPHHATPYHIIPYHTRHATPLLGETKKLLSFESSCGG